MTTLICGLYEFDQHSRTLTNRITQQSLRFVTQERETGLKFEYKDIDLEMPLFMRGNSGLCLTIDQNNNALLKFSYGKWRRITYFLIDCISVYYFRLMSRVPPFEISGIWANGVWVQGSTISTTLLNTSAASLKAEEFGGNIIPSSLDLKPNPWKPQATEQRLIDVTLVHKEMTENVPPLLASNPTLQKQLHSAPHVVCEVEDKWILYHRSEEELHRGELEHQMRWYQYINSECSFSMRAHPYYGIDSYKGPMIRHETADWQSFMKTTFKTGIPWHIELQPNAREELFFALIDATDAIRKLPKNSTIADNGYSFGEHLNTLSGLPYTTSLGQAKITISL